MTRRSTRSTSASSSCPSRRASCAGLGAHDHVLLERIRADAAEMDLPAYRQLCLS